MCALLWMQTVPENSIMWHMPTHRAFGFLEGGSNYQFVCPGSRNCFWSLTHRRSSTSVQVQEDLTWSNWRDNRTSLCSIGSWDTFCFCMLWKGFLCFMCDLLNVCSSWTSRWQHMEMDCYSRELMLQSAKHWLVPQPQCSIWVASKLSNLFHF